MTTLDYNSCTASACASLLGTLMAGAHILKIKLPLGSIPVVYRAQDPHTPGLGPHLLASVCSLLLWEAAST